MEKSNRDEEVKLTKNEKIVLKEVIFKNRISDSSIAGSMNISQQAVNKIRSKLEHLGIITGYIPIINFEKIGIKVILISGIQIKPLVWGEKKEWEIEESIRKIPFVFGAYRIIGHNISHALLMGFYDDYQRDKFIKKLETVYKDQLDIIWNYSISVKDIILQDPIGLLYNMIEKKEFELDSLFL